jgi:hypothetical protein
MRDGQHAQTITDAELLAEVAAELRQARAVHSPLNSHHEAYSVILEELDEYWAEVKKRRAQRDPARLHEELVQIAAMAVRTAVDCQSKDHSAARPESNVSASTAVRGDNA